MKRFSPYNLLRSFWYAARGIYYALTQERNLRIHFTAGAFVLYLTRYYSLTRGELGLLIVCIGLVMTCEMLNTAIERTVDLETMSYHKLARIAKDVAAGAVLVSAVASLAVGFLLFWDVPTIQLILSDMAEQAVVWILLLAAALGFILLPQKENFRPWDK